ncbi:MAG: hypothetical protein ABSB49_10435 [Polyangia bacterium]|jgi:hypothetical protein
MADMLRGESQALAGKVRISNDFRMLRGGLALASGLKRRQGKRYRKPDVTQ